jgi:glycosyltransferase involved in cell wall biosynthesis
VTDLRYPDMDGKRHNPPPISIITVCLNAAETIEQCIESVLGQELDDFEYVVMDGGSSDGTSEIIRRYAAGMHYWQSQPDRGIADAWNQGFARSTGSWLLFLNADDYLCNPQVLCRMAEAIAEHPDNDVVFGQIRLVGRGNESERRARVIGGPFAWQQFIMMDTIPHPAALTKREFFERYGTFSETFSVAMDYELFLRAGRRLRAHFVPVQVACMRDGGVSRTNVRGALRESLEAKTRNNVLSYPLAWLIYAYLLCRTTLKTGALRILGRS